MGILGPKLPHSTDSQHSSALRVVVRPAFVDRIPATARLRTYFPGIWFQAALDATTLVCGADLSLASTSPLDQRFELPAPGGPGGHFRGVHPGDSTGARALARSTSRS